jgi:hypothetical protein
MGSRGGVRPSHMAPLLAGTTWLNTAQSVLTSCSGSYSLPGTVHCGGVTAIPCLKQTDNCCTADWHRHCLQIEQHQLQHTLTGHVCMQQHKLISTRPLSCIVPSSSSSTTLQPQIPPHQHPPPGPPAWVTRHQQVVPSSSLPAPMPPCCSMPSLHDASSCSHTAAEPHLLWQL